MPTIFLLVLIASAAYGGAVGGCHHQNRRRLLHQPFFPVINSVPPPTTQPPSPAPSPEPIHHHEAQVPKYPFSTTPPNTPQRSFFPSYQASPPSPPPPSILSTIPANISSLLFPHRPTSSSAHRHVVLLSVSLSLLFAAILAAILAFLLYFRSRRRHGSDDKISSSRADSQRLFPPNLPPSDGPHKAAVVHRSVSSSKNPPPLISTNTSSEFLYLGTLVNSRSSSQEIPLNTTNAGLKIGVSTSPTAYRKLGSPELKPLPPLPKHNPSFTSGEMCFSKEETKLDITGDSEKDEEEEEEEFFSPRGSSGRKETRSPGLNPGSIRIGSSSRRENFGSRSFNSRTASYPYSNSNSPSNSITSDYCHSPVRNASPKSVASSRTNSLCSPDRASNLSGHSGQSQRRSHGESKPVVSMKLPPPPPPLPPPRFWEAPRAAKPSSGLPVLVAPSRPVVVQNPGPLGFGAGQAVKNESVETTPKPKLKPLHWDKVRASSDRVMVWDQLKSSSFQ